MLLDRLFIERWLQGLMLVVIFVVSLFPTFNRHSCQRKMQKCNGLTRKVTKTNPKLYVDVNNSVFVNGLIRYIPAQRYTILLKKWEDSLWTLSRQWIHQSAEFSIIWLYHYYKQIMWLHSPNLVPPTLLLLMHLLTLLLELWIDPPLSLVSLSHAISTLQASQTPFCQLY